MYFGNKHMTTFATFKNELTDIEELQVEVVENGKYTMTAADGIVYNKVTTIVAVPIKEEQTKAVTITENGTIQVVPDDGKTLSAVTITAGVSYPAAEEQSF